jgi:predicted aldo/keto reductase-like oxidoreductase
MMMFVALVPLIGTMLFGESQDQQLAEHLLDECLNAGVNFFDTAEMYPVPQRAETQVSWQYSWQYMWRRCAEQHQW